MFQRREVSAEMTPPENKKLDGRNKVSKVIHQ